MDIDMDREMYLQTRPSIVLILPIPTHIYHQPILDKYCSKASTSKDDGIDLSFEIFYFERKRIGWFPAEQSPDCTQYTRFDVWMWKFL